MQIICEVCFEKDEKKYNFDANKIKLKRNDIVVVQTENGQDIGTVYNTYKIENDYGEFLPVLRFANNADKERKEKNKKFEKEVKAFATQSYKKLNLDMKIVSVKVDLLKTKLFISFVSENRVDFRELVRLLANTYKTKIELKQLGPRDETKELGGIASCGQCCCCSTFLSEYPHSTIKMAKNQNLSLNPTKISGLCGKLLCCMDYENDTYIELSAKMPKIGAKVSTPDGNGICVSNNVIKGSVNVKVFADDGSYKFCEYDLAGIKF